MMKNNTVTKKGKSNVKMPLTKNQKKHQKLLLIIALLLVIIFIIMIIPKDNKKSNENTTKVTTTQVVEKQDLSVYDVNSKNRPYAVMIPNDSEAKKRQFGIQNAYLTYEITVEGGITRLLALFKDTSVEKIGPVRSSRHYFLDYALENDAIYVHFGWSPQAQSDISDLGINNLNGLYNPSDMFWRDKNYSSPNNAFTSTDNIKKAAEGKKYSLVSDNYELFKYNKEVDYSNDDTLKVANTVKVNYAGNSFVKYVYDDVNKYYLRYNNSNKHIDNLTSEQVHVKNILVLNMDTVNIAGDDKGRQNLNNIGKGEGYYISNGNSIRINWSKDSRTDKTVYKNSKGEEIILNDGNTFIQIQPTNKNITIE